MTASPEPTPGLREALREAIDYARLSPTGERRKRWEAALAASPAPEPTGLDADRLRVALKRWLDMATEAGLVGHVPPPEWLAIDYARLGEKP